jgi:hypothetical protein
MRKGDDRPKPSQPKLPAKEAAQPSRQCSICRLVSTSEDIFRTRKDDGAIVCVDDRDCRTRLLSIALGIELQQAKWLFFKYPRDRVYREMDIRPKDWRVTGWVPRYTMRERVKACILYHSWCYPVSLDYAVQLAGTLPRVGRDDPDPDAILCDDFNRPRPLKVMDIGRILNEDWQGNVSRAVTQLRVMKEIRVDEDHVLSPAAKLLDMSIEERRAFQGIQAPESQEGVPEEIQAFRKLLKSTPKHLRWKVALIQEQVPWDIRSDIFHRIEDACSAFSAGLGTLRTDRNTTIQKECSRAAYLIPDLERSRPPAQRASIPFVDPSPAAVPDDRSQVNPPSSTTTPEGEVVRLPRDTGGDLKRIRTAVEEAWGAPLQGGEADPIPAQLLAIAESQKIPVTALELWCAAFAAKKAADNVAIESPNLFVHAAPRALRPWYAGNRAQIGAEQARRVQAAEMAARAKQPKIRPHREDPRTEWAAAKARLRDSVSEDSFTNWFEGTYQLARRGDTLLVAVDSDAKIFLEREYSREVAEAVQPLTVTYVETDRVQLFHTLFGRIAAMQFELGAAHEDPVSSLEEQGDIDAVCLILDALAGADITAFCDHAAAEFKGLGKKRALAKMPPRSEELPGRARSLGLLMEWAKAWTWRQVHGKTNEGG